MNVTVPVQALTYGALGDLWLCPRHAVPPTRSRKRTFFTATPRWLFFLIFVSLLIAVIVAASIRQRASGSVPECDRCLGSRRLFVLGVVLGWVGWVALIIPAANAGREDVFGLWLAYTLVLLVLSCTGEQWRLRGVLSKDEQWVELKGVHPEFARAAETTMAAARAAATYPVAVPPG